MNVSNQGIHQIINPGVDISRNAKTKSIISPYNAPQRVP
ncbi:hypothetical protein CNEO2_500005 [Clostridium neonatale]|uniref:Uncharacterized protein n=1 Tax=Clostridium neonatale TaxID=137838 RepID=A0AA86JPQ2_9CLOT|nr:hypothetical protein CNEO_44120 [Clostridium neonatale]CAI3546009.1 hypothetical protein CNEO4_1100010 [Clostridium neonatale]CAI3695816.1 hypothetical protein CNEO2_500005 [Clostridium neonatale]